MPRSSRHKSSKHSKHSSKEYSGSEEDVVKMKEKSSSKDKDSGRANRDSASGEKRKILSHVRQGKDANDLGEVLEQYVSSSKRRKEKSDVVVVGDRWSGDEIGDSDRRNVESEMHKGESLKEVDTKLQGSSNSSKTRIESKSKSKTHGSGSAGERKEDSLASLGMEKEESKSKGESKWKSDRKHGVQGSKSGDERTGQEDLHNPELEKEIEKGVRRRRESSNIIDKHYDDSKESNEKRLFARGDRAKDLKHRDDKHKDGDHADKYQENGHKRRDEKCRKEADKDSKLRDVKYREDREKETRSRDDIYFEDVDRASKRKDEKYREDGERDRRLKDGKYRETIEKDGPRDDKYHEDGDNDLICGDESNYDGNRDNRKEEKFREDIEREIRHKDSKQGHSRDDGYAGNHQSRKSSAYYDDQDRRRNNEKADYVDIRSRGTRGKKSDAEKKSARRCSPSSSSHTPRDHYRALKQDESKYKDYNYEEIVQLNKNFSRDYTGATGGSEKITSSRSLEKIGVKDDGHLGELYTERRLNCDNRSSPLQIVDKSPSSSTDRTQLDKRDVRRSIDVEESTQSPRDDERLRVDTLSVSSPFVRNHFSTDSKSFKPPAPFRAGVESPHHHRRISDPNMGIIQGNMWRGVQSWNSPVGNGFLPFTHGPPPMGFPSVMQHFPPPMFGVRPSLELNHHSYLGRPMGWHNQVDNSYPQFHSLDSSNAVFGDYGRSSGEYSKGPNRTASLEMPSSEIENNSTRSADETLANQSIRSAETEQTPDDKQAECSDTSLLTKNSEKNDVEAPFISFGETSNVDKLLKKDDVHFSHFYLLNIDISADLTEPELCDKCTGMIDLDPSDVDEAKFLVMEEDIEAKMASHKRSSFTMFASTDNSVFQKSMSIYKRLKRNIWDVNGEKCKALSEFIPMADQNENDDKSKKLDIQGFEDAHPNFDIKKDHQNCLQIDLPVSNIMETSKKPVSAFDRENDVEEKPSSILPSLEVNGANNSDEHKSIDTKYGNLLNSDVSYEAVNLSRIHHSSESTH